MANSESPEPPSWALHHPYSASPSSPAVLQGTCHCTAIKYNLHADAPLASKFCHCADCQTMHGAPFQWAAIFHKDAMSFPDLDPRDLKFYKPSGEQAPEGQKPPLPCKVGCGRCGSWLFDEGRNMLLLFPSAIKWPSHEAKNKFVVKCHIFYETRVVDIPDGNPKWSGLDGKSEQLDLP